MALDLNWQTLTDAVNVMKGPPHLLFQELIFKHSQPLASGTINFDRMKAVRQILPAVTPVSGGTVMKGRTLENNSVTAPRLRPKRPFTAQDLLDVRAPGATPYIPRGAAPQIDAMQAKIADQQSDFVDSILLTAEYWCGQVLQGGKVLVDYEGGSQAEIDYKMPADHKIVLAGADKWNDAAATPDDDLREWSGLINAKTGLSLDFAVLGKSALTAFLGSPRVRDLLDRRRIEAGLISPNVKNFYLGTFVGVDMFAYSPILPGVDGTPKAFLADDAVVGGSYMAEASTEFGLIMDLDAHMGADPADALVTGASVQAKMFSKAWTQKDPSSLTLVVESRPLPVMWLPEGFIHADVL